MTAAIHESSRSANPESRDLRRARLLRAVVLLVAGIVIAFTATLHSDPAFDRWVLSASLLAIGITTIIEFFAIRATPASWLVAARATLALVAAAAILLSSSAFDTSLVLAVWAATSVIIAVVRVTQGSQARGVAVPSALLSGALAVLVLVFRDDLIAVIGFFGAYAIVRGVFLGISAFDTRGTVAIDPAESAPGDDAFAPAN
ncbi:MAG: hypothetical protein KKF42_00340 [Actinobacteria bacterium]|nr:hypothetical protein [Actinomycetota bacterium]